MRARARGDSVRRPRPTAVLRRRNFFARSSCRLWGADDERSRLRNGMSKALVYDCSRADTVELGWSKSSPSKSSPSVSEAEELAGYQEGGKRSRKASLHDTTVNASVVRSMTARGVGTELTMISAVGVEGGRGRGRDMARVSVGVVRSGVGGVMTVVGEGGMGVMMVAEEEGVGVGVMTMPMQEKPINAVIGEDANRG